MVIKGFVNPYSQKNKMQFVIRHYPKCQGLPDEVNKQEEAKHSRCKIYKQAAAEATYSCFGPEIFWPQAIEYNTMIKDFKVTSKLAPNN